MFGYVSGGYARVLERFGESLASKGVEIKLNSYIEKIERLGDGRFRVHVPAARRRTDKRSPQKTKYGTMRAAAAVAPGFSGAFLSEPDLSPKVVQTFPGSDEIFDKVILTCPSNVAAKLAPQLTDREKMGLQSIRYQGIVCASVLTKCSLSGFYVTNITDETPFTGVIEMSALVDKKEFGRNALVYLPKYVDPDDELFDKTDDEIEESFLDALAGMYPHFKRQDVLAFKVSRVRQVFPLPVLNYSRDLLPAKTSVDGLYIVNSSHIVNGTLNVNETVQLAERFFAENFRGPSES
jgi:hypothetical protein